MIVTRYKKFDPFAILLALLVALGPILQHYKAAFWDMGSDLYILLMPVVVIMLLSKKTLTVSSKILPLVFLGLWIGLSHGLSLNVFGRELLLILLYVAFDSEVIDIELVIRSAVVIAEAAAVLIFIQYICYYIGGFHLQLVPTSLLKSNASQWILLAQTGRISVTGSLMSFYRPSAFFLEPSHLAIFCIPLLIYLLTSHEVTKKDRLSAMIISAGIVLSTSGIGIVSCIGIWCVYLLLYNSTRDRNSKSVLRKFFKPRNIVVIILIIVTVVLLFCTVPFFRKSIMRIFVSEAGGNNAMQARNATGARIVKQLSGKQLLLGVGLANKGNIAEWNVAGFYYMYYIYGIVGVVLSMWFYVSTIAKKIEISAWASMFIIVLSFFSVHTYAVFYRFYLTMFAMAGYKKENADKSGRRLSLKLY